tara:strand:- start:1975 stop:3171 length:1197 start_codon:yes stop_codon:yes gene_type:complete
MTLQRERELPSGWKWVKLEDVCESINGRGFKKSEWKQFGLPIIRIENLNNRTADYNYFDGDLLDKHHVTDGDLLVSWSASLDAYIWDRGAAALNQHIFKIIPNFNLVDKTYLYSALKNVMSSIRSKTHGGTMTHITKGVFDGTYIPLPPLKEQKRIAGILNRVDEIKSLREEAYNKATELINSIFHDMAGKYTQETELPDGWKWVKLGDIGRTERGITFSSKETQSEPTQGYVACITTSAIQNVIIWGTARYVPLITVKKEQQLIKTGDIAISTANSSALVGKAALVNEVPFECAFGAFVTIYRPQNLQLAKWVYQCIQEPRYKRFVSRYASNTTNISNLKPGDLLKFEIPLPPLVEQERIMERIHKAESIRDATEESLRKVEELQASMLQKAFRGEI